ncbi:SGNH/GDSL hydrolase family protein [Cohnella sp. AR92]|uniref:SGNH/GDSL hydrolase family protein n=1 Tax=Cohnella sp. AR92 TaxID=648716 RepID=UPI00192DA726|nr:SGNH/GDSL hydrolase family protein [Cohnella sp. AR92]
MASGDMQKSVYDKDNNGVVDQAAKLQTARTIALTGDVTGKAAFDGSANVSIATTLSGGSASSAIVAYNLPNIRVVGKRNEASFTGAETYAGKDSVTGTKGGVTFRQKHIFTVNSSDVQWVFQNPSSWNTASLELKVTLEVPSGTGDVTFYPLTVNASRTITVGSDQTVRTDKFRGAFTKGQTVYLRIYAKTKWPLNWRMSISAGDGWIDGDLTNQTAGVFNNSQYYNGTTIVNGATTESSTWSMLSPREGNGYGAILCIGRPNPGSAPYPVVALFGDSISKGVGMGSSTYGLSYGFMQMAVNAAGGSWIDLGGNGESLEDVVMNNGYVSTYVSDRFSFLPYCTHAMIEYGVNDINSPHNQGSTAISSITNLYQTLISGIKNAGVKVYSCVPGVSTSSTDSFSTVANQTPTAANFKLRANGGNEVWGDLNRWLHGSSVQTVSGSVIPAPIGLDAVFDTGIIVTTSKTNGDPVWKASYTNDGIHPNSTAHPLMAALIPASAFAISAVSGGGSGSGDMSRSTYDTNGDGIVDQAAKLQNARNIILAGDVSGSASFDGSKDVTITVSAPSTGDMKKSVYDTNGDGIVDQASKLQNARNIILAGDVSGSANFDGSKDVTITTSAPSFGDMKKNVYDANGDGVVDQTAKLQNARNIILAGDVSGSANFDGSRDVTITTSAPNFGDMKKSVYDANGDGIVDQAAKLQTARTISLTGGVSGSATFDGSSNVTISTTVIGTGAGIRGQVILNATAGTDATAAFQNAIATLNTLGGGTLVIPAGEYFLRKQLVLNKIIIKGMGAGVSLITVDTSLGDGVAAILMNPPGSGFTTGMEDVTLRGGTGTWTLGVKTRAYNGVEMTKRSFLNRVNISDFGHGLVINGASHSSMTHCYFSGSYYNVYFKNDQGDHNFIDCTLDHASFAAIAVASDHSGHPETFFLRCHLSVCPFGIYQEAPVSGVNPIAFLIEWVLDSVRFEGIGNAAIYSESWNSNPGLGAGGLIGVTIRNPGFGWYVDVSNTLSAYPTAESVIVGQCRGTIIYEPGLSGFTYYNSDTLPGIRIRDNAAKWVGSFDNTSFNILGGYFTINGQARSDKAYKGTSGGNVFIDQAPMRLVNGYYQMWQITLTLKNYVNSTSTAQSIPFQFPLTDMAQATLLQNTTGMPASAILQTNYGNAIQLNPNSKTSYSGTIIFIGY